MSPYSPCLPLILVFSDLHIGRFAEQDEAILTDLKQCVGFYRNNSDAPLSEVIFLGDVFDAFMEYPRKISPLAKPFSLLLSELAAAGVTVSYHVGNHDPWHDSYFGKILNGRLYKGPVERELCSRRVYLSHGDEASNCSFMGHIARYFMRSEFWYKFYVTLIPSGIGQKIPAWISRKFAGIEPRTDTISAMRNAALQILDTPETDLVMFGHAHQSTSEITANGQYVNTGCWLLSRSYVEISDDLVRIRLFQKSTLHIESSS